MAILDATWAGLTLIGIGGTPIKVYTLRCLPSKLKYKIFIKLMEFSVCWICTATANSIIRFPTLVKTILSLLEYCLYSLVS